MSPGFQMFFRFIEYGYPNKDQKHYAKEDQENNVVIDNRTDAEEKAET